MILNTLEVVRASSLQNSLMEDPGPATLIWPDLELTALDLLNNLAELAPDPSPDNPAPTRWAGAPLWCLLLGIQGSLLDRSSPPDVIAAGCRAYVLVAKIQTCISDPECADDRTESQDQLEWLLITKALAPNLPIPAFPPLPDSGHG